MRIVLVNWAKIWDGASHGGGVNGYCQSLALALRARGHDVVSLFGGTTEVDEHPACHVKRHDDWFGIKVFEVVNSPVLAPAIVQFRDPMGEVSAPELEARLAEFFDWLGPDVVHFHNVEGFSAGCIDVARSSGARVLYSLHNYHTICPQVYLMQGHRFACTDFDNGHRCETCIETTDPGDERRLRARKLRESPDDEVGAAQREVEAARWDLRAQLGWPYRALKAGVRLAGAKRRLRAARNGLSVVGRFDESGGASSARPVAGGDERGQSAQIREELAEKPDGAAGGGRSEGDETNRRPLLNVIQPEPASDREPNDYAKRRQAMVGMLNSCDRVLAVSDFVRRKLESMGVDAEVIRAMHIGSRINSIVEKSDGLVFDPPGFDPLEPRPVRLVFMGYNHHYKGLSMLYESLAMLPPEDLARIDLSIFALDGESIEWLFRRLEPRLAGLLFTCGYSYHDIPWMLGGKDLTVVCSVWWDNAPQTVFESLACGVPVLGAEIGGIPDFIHDGVNGLLFRANDREHLAARLSEIVNDPSRLTTMRANVEPPKGIDEHAEELVRLYEDLIERNPSASRVAARTGAS